jgi:hypothetical protein
MGACERDMIEGNILGESITAGVGAIAGGFAGWLWAASRKLSKADMDNKLAERDKLVIGPIQASIHELRVEQKEFVTREHLKEIMADWRTTNDAQHALLRADIARLQLLLEKRN